MEINEKVINAPFKYGKMTIVITLIRLIYNCIYKIIGKEIIREKKTLMKIAY